MCQIISHALKLAYFGGIIEQAGTLDPVLAGLAIVSSMVGTTVAKRFLEMMSDRQFRVWANRIIATICGYYIIHGTTMLIISETAAK